ncbi:MAG: ATP-binding cassette domain-containing protein [Oscillospiraceae bacterium]|nr:ATP-binding cassette domain-containing protein [Oscillospiraceae bacterium]
MSEALLTVDHLKMYFPVQKGLLKHTVGWVKAVDDVSFTVERGKTLGIVGESGSGKSTIGHCVVRDYKATGGSVTFDGIDMAGCKGRELQKLRQKIQMVNQDPYSSLDPRMNVGQLITEGPRYHHYPQDKETFDEKVERLLGLVDLNPSYADRFPHEFSGGQRQRIAIARALAMEPDFIVCDEVVSALDVSIQAQVVSLLMELQRTLGLTYIFIGHDLSVVRYISDNVAVLYLGKVMEYTSSDELYENPLHPYTKALISAVPIPDPVVDRARERILLKGEIPSPIDPPKGCNFCTRCPYATNECRGQEPEYREIAPGHFVACHRVMEGGGMRG